MENSNAVDSNSSMDSESNIPAGGVVAEHTPVATRPVLVGPTTSDRSNTIRAAIIPIACWRLDDIRFEFSSSFVKPDIAREMTLFAKLVQDHSGAPASIFGHADPIGSDVFNKKLSGRRAAVIHGLLTRNTDLWEDVYSQTGKFTAALEDDAWGLRVVKTILEALGYSPGPLDDQMRSQTRDAVRSFQTDQGFLGRDVDGDPGPQTRAKLFLAFMDKICRDENDQPFKMAPTDFLGQGTDREGKGDYQGCSEFNPVLLFSQEESDRFAQARDRTERNAANAPNRRVLVLLFRPGSKVNVDRWPCPRAKEGIDACKKRFWSDSTRRLALQAERRTFDQSRDTFACRFYDRIANDSPCERLSPVPIAATNFVEFLFRDGAGHRVEALCRFTDPAGNTESFQIAAEGRIFRDRLAAGTCRVETVNIREIRWEPEFVGPGEPVEVVAEFDPPVEGIPLSIAIYREGRELSSEALARAEDLRTGPAGQARFRWQYEPQRDDREDQRFLAKVQIGSDFRNSPVITLQVPMLANASWRGSVGNALQLGVEVHGVKPGTPVNFSVYRMHFAGTDAKIADLPSVSAREGLIETSWEINVPCIDADVGQKQAYVYFVAGTLDESLRSDHCLVPLPSEPHPQPRRSPEHRPVEQQAPFEWRDPEEGFFA